MTHENDSHEPVTVTDRRRIDPETGAVRDPAAVPTPEGPAPAAEPAGGTDEAAELKATLQRVKAEYDNFRKRTEREKLLAAERGKVSAVLLLLPVLDDLERARTHGDLETGPLKSVADKLGTALDSLGLVSFGTEGDDFDPSRHEAVQHDGDGSHPVLGTVMRRGYLLGENVLRPALVGVVDQEPASGEPPADAAPGETV